MLLIPHLLYSTHPTKQYIHNIMNIKHIALSLAAVAAIMPTAMAGQKNQATLQAVKFSNVDLVRKGDKMTVTFDVDVTDLKLKRDQQIIYTPVLVGEGDSIAFGKIVLNGRNVALKEEREPQRRITGANTMRRYNGTAQTVNVSETVPFAEWMNYSKLYLAEDLCGCGTLQDQDRVPVGEFDNRPAPKPSMTFVTPKAEAVKARAEKGSAFVDYVVNKTNILPDYRGNRKEIAKIVATIDLVKNDPNVSITEINIHGYASPEGPYDNNTRLANGRAASLKEYVRSLYTLPENIFTSNATPEDWEGLRRLVVGSDLKEKTEILALIDDTAMDPDAKDHEIRRRFPQTYQFMLKNWYPGLRHSDYTVSYVVRPFTVEETKEIMLKTPKQVSLNEMFLVAKTLQPGSPEFNEVMDIAVATYPDDETANLNAACAALNDQNWDKAENYLRKAGNTPEAAHARGVLAMNRGEYDQAERYLTEAKNAGIASAETNLEILERLRRLARQNQE